MRGLALLSSSPGARKTGAQLDWNLGPLYPGASGTAVVAVSLTAGLGSTVQNCVTFFSATDGPVTSCVSIAVVTPTPRPVIVLGKSASDHTRAAGETLVYTLTYMNVGDGDASNSVLTDDLPAGLSYLGAAPPETSFGGGVLTWVLGLLPPGPQGSVFVTLVVDPGTEGLALVNKSRMDFDNAFAPGNPSWSDSPAATVYVQSPDLFQLDHNAFNPSQGQTLRIIAGSSAGGRIGIHVYNSAGELVRTLLDLGAPYTKAFDLSWDGRNDAGNPVSSGIYILRYTSPAMTRSRRVAVIR